MKPYPAVYFYHFKICPDEAFRPSSMYNTMKEHVQYHERMAKIYFAVKPLEGFECGGESLGARYIFASLFLGLNDSFC